jgi:hypothetical protein
MSKSNTTENDVLQKIFNNVALSWDAATNFQVHLHVADPGEGGTTATSPATYTSYAPVTVARTSGGWTVSGSNSSNTGLIQFPQCSGGSNTITHVSVSPASSTQILYSGALNSSINVSSGIQPQFAASALVVTED